MVIDDRDHISALTGDEVTLNHSLEAECLTNDQRAKNGERTQLTYHDLAADAGPCDSLNRGSPVLSIASDPLGLARALLRNVGDDRIGQGGSTITQQLVRTRISQPSGRFNAYAGGDARLRSRTPAFQRRHLCPVL